jgi:glutamine amidotransferase
MESLESLGLTDTLREAFARGTPILGICVGSQVIFERSEEDDGTPGLGLLPGSVVRFRFREGATEKIPHMGWNQVEFLDAAGAAPVSRGHPVFAGIESGSEFYFVHSYYPEPARPEDLLATAVYGGVRFACAVGRDNLVAVQFHAEKSGRFGLRLLDNFLRWRT